jgi:hypothetical protein
VAILLQHLAGVLIGWRAIVGAGSLRATLA